MKAYYIKSEICCELCRAIMLMDYGKAQVLTTPSDVAEWLHDKGEDTAKCIYCDTIIEHDSELLSQLHQKSEDTAESDEADKRAWHNGRFGR